MRWGTRPRTGSASAERPARLRELPRTPAHRGVGHGGRSPVTSSGPEAPFFSSQRVYAISGLALITMETYFSYLRARRGLEVNAETDRRLRCVQRALNAPGRESHIPRALVKCSKCCHCAHVTPEGGCHSPHVAGAETEAQTGSESTIARPPRRAAPWTAQWTHARPE